MSKEENINAILEKVRSLSSSYAAAPYSVSSTPVPENLRVLNAILFKNYTDMIFVNIWNDYMQTDAGEYIGLSKECLSIQNEEDRSKFVLKRMETIFKDTETFKDWKERQAYFALGLVISASKQLDYDLKILDINEFEDDCRNEIIRSTAKNLIAWHIVLL